MAHVQAADMTRVSLPRADVRRNRRAILDAALGLIADGDDLTVSAVSRRAGLSRVTVYAHFPTVATLVESTVREAIQDTAAAIRSSHPDDAAPVPALVAVLRTSWSVLGRYQALHAVASAAVASEHLTTLHEPVLGELRRRIEAAQRTGSVRRDLPMDWLLDLTLQVLHLASQQVRTGLLAAAEAEDVVVRTLLPVYGITPTDGSDVDGRG